MSTFEFLEREKIAEVHAVRRQSDKAFEYLERAWAHGDTGLQNLLASPALRSLHEDARWIPFVRKMNLAD